MPLTTQIYSRIDLLGSEVAPSGSTASIGAGTDTDDISITGNVGIGLANPHSKLTVYGSGQATAAMDTTTGLGASLALVDDTVAAGNGGSVLFGNRISGSANVGIFAAIKSLVTSASNNTSGGLAFSTRGVNTDSTLTERLRIADGGNVILSTGNLYSANASSHFNLYSGPATGLGISFNCYSGSSYRSLILYRSDTSGLTYNLYENSASDFLLRVNNAGSGVFNMAVEGSLAVGSTSAASGSYKIDCVGSIKASNYYSSDNSRGKSGTATWDENGTLMTATVKNGLITSWTLDGVEQLT